jgi:biopolymer transport protein ExbD/biopolymer transport protein TolR
MKDLLKACLVALTIIATIDAPVAAQFPVLRAGVSVELPATSNAVPMPDADKQDSLVLAVTVSGRVYFGTTPVNPADLTEKVKGGLSGRTGKKLFIKGDSRTPYAGIAKVLDAVRMAGVEAPNLLTAQRDSPESGKPLPPKGLEVLVGPSLPSASESIALQVLNAGQQPTLSINNERISLDTLQATLRQLFQNRSQKTVVLRADERLPFGDVVRVIDTCRSAGAKVFLATAGM